MKDNITLLTKFGFAFVIMVLISGFVFNFESLISHKTYGEESKYKVYALELPDNLSFAGEKIPLQSPDLRERLDRELLVNTYWQSNMMLLIKRANKYFPTIEKILAEEGVPIDLKYLSVIESGLENVISPMGAKGFWQIMRTTGREYGLEVNSNVDERYHLEFSTRMAAKYLKKAREKFGSWTLAVASYNIGVSGIQRNLNILGFAPIPGIRYIDSCIIFYYFILSITQKIFNFAIPSLNFKPNFLLFIN